MANYRGTVTQKQGAGHRRKETEVARAMGAPRAKHNMMWQYAKKDRKSIACVTIDEVKTAPILTPRLMGCGLRS
jgi:hypothetical protein